MPNVYRQFCIRRAEVQTRSFVLLMNICNKLELCTPKSARTQSPEPITIISKSRYLRSVDSVKNFIQNPNIT